MAVTIKYLWDKQAFIALQQAYYKYIERTPRGIIGTLLFIAIFFFALYMISRYRFDFGNGFLLLFSGFFLILRKPYIAWMAAARFKHYTEKNLPVEWQVDAQGFSGGTELSSGKFSWQIISNVIRLKDGFLVIRYPLFHWFPLSAFGSEQDISEFDRLVQEKVPTYKRIG